ncbi:hypothetical protein FGG08_007118 [Glutinoglossum americanum]|uniref:ABC transporter domain-containing protein n=1 Tax=Glutinoglossum americanum TaxID=1670608 RepID=A0A9P8KWS5_9PEZI|nr:hypothetical protein FGG08_007118 [Glutinoglossum americanum]
MTEPKLESGNAANDDLECGEDGAHLDNATLGAFSWQKVTVTVKDHKTKQAKEILSNVNGCIKAGELLALIGPSGSGKTTLLNVLAHREATSGAKVESFILVDGTKPSLKAFQRLSSYVEQEDALIGSLTVRETLYFAACLSLPRLVRGLFLSNHILRKKKSSVTAGERTRRIDSLLGAFGLHGQAQTLIGTPVRKGISGGQKRRVSVASQLITSPKILFLDEPTSGLDSAASYEVMSFIRTVAKQHNLLVIASIHQPSTSTFKLFDKLLLLSAGKTCYYGPVHQVKPYFDGLGFPLPIMMNPAEFLLEQTNVDFARDREHACFRLGKIQDSWANSPEALAVLNQIGQRREEMEQQGFSSEEPLRSNKYLVVVTLLHRSFIKSYRDVVAYGIRFVMYTGLAIMMGTIWLRLDTSQGSIQPFINAIFFGSAFMSFMAVAYVPAFLEDRGTFIKERANGLYGATSFMITNFLIGMPYLFTIAVIFSVLSYWLANFHPTATSFLTYIMWLFIDLLAAESLVVLISSLFPNFVVSLALVAFANGLWMCVGGFLVNPTILNVFWRYVFHYIDYQTWVFQGMMVNEFAHREYSCGIGCTCMYQTDLAPKCMIAGTGVLDAYGYTQGRTAKWVGILLGIVVGYRMLGWVVLQRS